MAPQRCPRGTRRPHQPLPAATAAPSGVSADAAGVWGVAGGREGAELPRQPAPPVGRGRGGWAQVQRPWCVLTPGTCRVALLLGRSTCRAVLGFGLLSFLHMFSPSSTFTLYDLWQVLFQCIREFALRLATEGPQVSDLMQRNIRQHNSTLFSLLFLLPTS